MRRSNKNINGKKYRVWVILVLMVIGVFFGILRQANIKSNDDYRFGLISDKVIKIVSISPERKMVNILNTETEKNIWVAGLGWKKVGELKSLIEKDKNQEITTNIFINNFGFLPDKIYLTDNLDKWDEVPVLIANLGLVNWLKFRFNSSQMLFKEEEFKNDLDEIMPRDFADSRVINEDLKLSVFNSTSEEGLANFVGKRLEWAGFSVVTAENTSKKVNKCLILYGPKADLTVGWKLINKMYKCETKFDNSVNENEVELYFGDNYVSMIKYDSYNVIKN